MLQRDGRAGGSGRDATNAEVRAAARNLDVIRNFELAQVFVQRATKIGEHAVVER